MWSTLSTVWTSTKLKQTENRMCEEFSKRALKLVSSGLLYFALIMTYHHQYHETPHPFKFKQFLGGSHRVVARSELLHWPSDHVTVAEQYICCCNSYRTLWTQRYIDSFHRCEREVLWTPFIWSWIKLRKVTEINSNLFLIICIQLHFLISFSLFLWKLLFPSL